MRKTKSWVVVADARQARLLHSDHPGAGLTALEDGTLSWPSVREQETFSDRQGRSFDSAGAGRHAMERPSSAKEQGLRSFAGAIVDRIIQAHQSGLFDRLALVAAPKMLGELRLSLPPEIARMVVAELAKDLTDATPEEIVVALEGTVRL